MRQLEREAPRTQQPLRYAAISDALWLQRETLQEVLCRSGRRDAGVTALVEGLRCGEVLRAAAVQELAEQLELDEDVTLAQLIVTAPEPWDMLLADHRRALVQLLHHAQIAAGVHQLSLAEFLR